MPPEEDHKAVVRRLFVAVNRADNSSLDELVAADCENIGPAGAGRAGCLPTGLWDAARGFSGCARHN